MNILLCTLKILTARNQPRELEENASVVVKEEMRHDDSDHGTEERRLVVAEEESGGGHQQAHEDELDNSQPLDLSVPRRDIGQSGEGNQDTSGGTLFQNNVVVAVPGPPTSGSNVLADETPQVDQGSSTWIQIHRAGKCHRFLPQSNYGCNSVNYVTRRVTYNFSMSLTVVRRATGGSPAEYVPGVSLGREDKFAKVREGTRQIEAFLADLGGNKGT
jgi:hypothetical protein